MSQDGVHTIVALLRDQPGVLNRVASIIRRRGFNIASLSVGQCETEGLSRVTFVVKGSDEVAYQATTQLRKLIDVVRVADISAERMVAREMALVKVRATPETRSEIIQVADIFRAAVVDVSPDSVVIEVTGDEEKVDSLITLLRPFGVCEVMRSGRLAMVRGMVEQGDSTSVVRQPVWTTTEHAVPLVEPDRSGG
ncbi:MAG: acetolactate synthase small subunit [Dehalococcoidia bacterium]|nr:acetolactate synthase small subunit [Dehalococcoidia bacterium]